MGSRAGETQTCGGKRFPLGSFGASNTGKLLYNPRALPIRFAKVPGIGLKDYVWRCKLLINKAPVAQPDRAPAF
jgi:hypothetical protein